MSIPYSYSLKETSEGAKEVKGILSFLDSELLFEYKVYDEDGNSLSTLSKFSIQLGHIKKVQLKKSVFGNALLIEALHAAFFEPLPGNEQGAISLKTKRGEKSKALKFTQKMNEYLSQIKDEAK